MKQVARNLGDADDGSVNGTRLLIDDRDSLFTQASSKIPEAPGVTPDWVIAKYTDFRRFTGSEVRGHLGDA